MIVKCDLYTDATYVFFPDQVQLSGKYGKAAPAKYSIVLLSSTYTMRTICTNQTMFITPTHINFSLKHCYNHNGPWLQKVKQTNKQTQT